MDSATPGGLPATASSLVSGFWFVTTENIETRCSPYSTVLPPGSRGRVSFVDKDGDVWVKIPSAGYLNNGNVLCIPCESIGRCQHLLMINGSRQAGGALAADSLG
jgi:hypothetical protein